MSPELAQWKQAIQTVLEIVESFNYERIAKLYFLIFKKVVNYLFLFLFLMARTRNIILNNWSENYNIDLACSIKLPFCF